MNIYLIIGLVITMAGVLLMIYDKIKRREKYKDNDMIVMRSGIPLHLDPRPSGGSRNGARRINVKVDTNPRTNPRLKPIVDPIKQKPYIDDDGYARKMEWTERQVGMGVECSGSYIIDEEHEITIKRRALDKMKDLAMFGQPKPVVYVIAEMRVR